MNKHHHLIDRGQDCMNNYMNNLIKVPSLCGDKANKNAKCLCVQVCRLSISFQLERYGHNKGQVFDLCDGNFASFKIM